ncbi:scavenger receptor cysteine-rich type 1 protein M130-like [Chiloscyllium punctatum]|uniref:scavenger receptor cysteine-rich type 1 protein M130-like n=1 Tax=Chiloscyllium punctatum TaxID=137246 RepID=UPI003B639B29
MFTLGSRYLSTIWLIIRSHMSVRKDENWALRLVNGESRCDGRVEVYYNGSWGGVQDTVWDQNDANVVCRQLGCGYALEIYNSSKYGESDGGSWVHVVQCHGHESQLQDCRISNTLNSSVTEGSGVGVLCSEHFQLRLSDGGSPCAGRVEIYYNGIWGSVCDDSWDVVDAGVVCKQLGCGKALDMTLPSSSGPGSGHIWWKDVKCFGNESFLWEYTQDSVHLHGGSSNCSGRVEIMCDKRWGTLCGDSWDITDANVVCRELGCGFAVSARDEAVLSQEKDVIWQNDVKCKGREFSLFDCLSAAPAKRKCHHKEIASVKCSGSELVTASPSPPPAGITD